jgi:AMP nucleosidase
VADARPLRRAQNTQALGDYVLAHGYVREDHVSTPICRCGFHTAAAEVQVALEEAVAEVTASRGSS